MSLSQGGRYANHRKYDLKVGCIVLNVEDMTECGLISHILLYDTNCYVLCEKLMQVRDETSFFPVHVRSGVSVCYSIHKVSKSAVFYYHRHTNAYTILNPKSL